MKKFLIFFMIIGICFAAPSTKDRIKDSKSSLRSNEQMSQQLNKKLDDLAADIINGDAKLKGITKEIVVLKEQILALEGNATSVNAELEELTSQNKELVQTQKEIEKNIIRIIAEDFSLDLMLDDDGVSESEDSIIATQILNKLNHVLQDDFKKMAKNYENTLGLIRSKSDRIDQIQSSIKNYKSKQDSLILLQEKQKSTINALKRDKEIYTKKLQKLQIQKDEIRKTLEELAIIAKREDEAAARARAEKLAKENAKKGKKTDTDTKELASQSGSVKRYRGEKTIAPLDDFVVKQKFGNYVDPIYNIKIFNESVVLHSKTPDAKVKSVLNGKVVFAKLTPLLENVIITENDNGIHTIYAHLSNIAPTIKVGARVQKGMIIGRVRDDLTFEVTQKNAHIDPLELIHH